MSTEITHDTAHDEHDHHGPAKGLMRWVTTTNHKDIGTLYLWLSFIMLLYGGGMAMIIRLELFQPGLQFRCDHAGIRWPGELAGADDDRRARYGVAAHE
jgi:hypothetical protein